MVFRLPDDEIIFPDPTLADPDGLLAIGGDLTIERLLLAYESGIFPWFSEDDPICWYAPHDRCVIFPSRVNVSKSMNRLINSGLFKVTFNKAFSQVIVNCAKAKRKDQPGTWITDQMQTAYINLHENGYAGSVEVWQNEVLVGGLYGVLMGSVFCGESMFSAVSNASKVALIALCRSGIYELIDCQLPNDHLMSMGAEMITMVEYQRFLQS